MAEDNEIVLYHSPASRAFTAFWLLEELGLTFRVETVDITKGEQKSPEYLKINPAVVQNPDKVTGTVCLGPMRDQSQVRGVYLYSPADRIKDTTVAYGAAYPVGLTPTNESDTGLSLKATSVDGFRADGSQLNPVALGDPSPDRST